jgi:cephalosporin hydroxylase
MKITIDTGAATVTDHEADPQRQVIPLASAEAFALVSKAWLRVGWDTKHVYTFTWLGRPIIQLPEDMFRFQETVWRVRPTVIVEVGIAHGGSLIFSAALCELLGAGRVIGVDIEVRPHNRAAIEAHPLSKRITLIEGNSIAPEIVSRVSAEISPQDCVMVVLDGCHTLDHVLAELRAYGPLVTPDSYIIAADGIMQDLEGAPRSRPGWSTDNPVSAIDRFIAENDNFVSEEPAWLFNESEGLTQNITYWPSGYLRRKPSDATEPS